MVITALESPVWEERDVVALRVVALLRTMRHALFTFPLGVIGRQ